MPRNEQDIIIGRVVAPFGLRGEVKVMVITDFPERFRSGLETTLILSDGTRRDVRIDKNTPNKTGLTIKFQGVDNRNDAEDLRKAEIVIDQSQLVDLEDGQFYLFDIIGIKVVTDDGREQGEVVEVLQGGANDVYVTSTGLCIPALKHVVTKIDIKNRLMVIHPVPGLLAEN